MLCHYIIGGGGPEGGRGTAHKVVESGFASARGQKLSVSVSSIQRGQQIISDEKENGMESSIRSRHARVRALLEIEF